MNLVPAPARPLDHDQLMLDALAHPAAILGPDARVVTVNAAWRALAEDGELTAFRFGGGSARTSGCDCGQRETCDLSEAAAESIVGVVFGHQQSVSTSAACEASGASRWFRVDVGALPRDDGRGALVMFVELTEYKLPLARMADIARCVA